MENFLRAYSPCPFGSKITDDIQKAIWTPMVLLATNAGISTTSRLPIRVIFSDEETRNVAATAFREVEAIAHVRGAELDIATPVHSVFHAMLKPYRDEPPMLTG